MEVFSNLTIVYVIIFCMGMLLISFSAYFLLRNDNSKLSKTHATVVGYFLLAGIVLILISIGRAFTVTLNSLKVAKHEIKTMKVTNDLIQKELQQTKENSNLIEESKQQRIKDLSRYKKKEVMEFTGRYIGSAEVMSDGRICVHGYPLNSDSKATVYWQVPAEDKLNELPEKFQLRYEETNKTQCFDGLKNEIFPKLLEKGTQVFISIDDHNAYYKGTVVH